MTKMSFLVILSIDMVMSSDALNLRMSPYSRIIPENYFAFLFVKVENFVLLLVAV